MFGRKTLGHLVVPILLSGCATTSFAPPEVNVVKTYSVGGRGCDLKATSTDISKDQVGALALVDNFLFTYRCAQRELADGRQNFEVPAALALMAGAVAAAIGKDRDVAIATGSAAALFSRGNSYYAPKDKARLVQAAGNAFLCIRNEMTGIPPLAPLSDSTKTRLMGVRGGASAPIEFEPQHQYFVAVGSAALRVESILAQRLSSIGTYSPDSIASDITAAAKKLDDARGNPGQTRAANQANAIGVMNDTDRATIVSQSVLLGELQAKLDLCTLQAKT